MEEIIKECDNCKYVMTDTESFPCNRCTRNSVDKWEPIPKQTNADRIRSMDDEELAEFIKFGAPDCSDCCSDFKAGCAFSCNHNHGNDVIFDWLQSEAE